MGKRNIDSYKVPGKKEKKRRIMEDVKAVSTGMIKELKWLDKSIKDKRSINCPLKSFIRFFFKDY